MLAIQQAAGTTIGAHWDTTYEELGQVKSAGLLNETGQSVLVSYNVTAVVEASPEAGGIDNIRVAS
jgi:hypothetical protein